MAVTYDMSGVHGASLRILKEIDRICRKYKIRYCLDAGTLIGAVPPPGVYPLGRRRGRGVHPEPVRGVPQSGGAGAPPEMELLDPDAYRNGKAFYDFTPRIIYKTAGAIPTRRRWRSTAES